MSRILIADDEPTIREVISFALERAGLSTVSARNGAEALQMFRKSPPDLIILDIGMPEMDGLEVCRQIRRISEVPILFLSARDEEIDRVLGLEIGGDDYVTKPFSARELVARVNVILKRARGGAVRAPAPMTHGGLRLDIARHSVRFAEKAVNLTALEFEILARIDVAPRRRVFARTGHGRGLWRGHLCQRPHHRQPRAKSACEVCGGWMHQIIETVHGVGFRLGAAD